MIEGMEKNKGAQGKIQKHLTGSNIMLPPDDIPKYSELGITKMQSHRWQRISKLPEEAAGK